MLVSLPGTDLFWLACWVPPFLGASASGPRRLIIRSRVSVPSALIFFGARLSVFFSITSGMWFYLRTCRTWMRCNRVNVALLLNQSSNSPLLTPVLLRLRLGVHIF
ncbi:hypothetical protein C8R44DRAFT_815372 [Mycena epipterygia]|nr:hypothetical protein C8R44DRAFT_815372 [Mycena epipterygia]